MFLKKYIKYVPSSWQSFQAGTGDTLIEFGKALPTHVFTFNRNLMIILDHRFSLYLIKEI